MNCHKCNQELPNGVKFCSECGETILQEASKTCKNCGKVLIKDAKFCLDCGEKVSNKNICTECGIENKPLARFCAECGYSFSSLQQKKNNSSSTKEVHHHYHKKQFKRTSTRTGVGALLNFLFIPGTGYFVAGDPALGLLVLIGYAISLAINLLLCLAVIGFATLIISELLFRFTTFFHIISTEEQ